MTGTHRSAVPRRLSAVALVGALLAGLVSTAAATVDGDPVADEPPTTTTAPATTVPPVEPPPTTVPVIDAAPKPLAPPTTPVAPTDEGGVVEEAEKAAAGALDEAVPAESHAEIEITKTADVDAVLRNKVVEFTITVENTGDVDLVDVGVVDLATPDCEDDTGALPAGGSPWSYDCYAYNVQGDEDEDDDDDVFTNVAVVTAEVPVICVDLTEDVAGSAACEGEEVSDEASASVDVVDPDPDITIVKTALDPVVFAGEDADFEITVTNSGNVDLDEIEVSDALVEDCEEGFNGLDPGQSESYTCTAASVSGAGDGDGDGDVFTNVAEVQGFAFDDCEGLTGAASPAECGEAEVSDEDDATVKIARPGIDITKTALTSPVPVGGSAGFAIAVTNTGNVKLTGITVADPLAESCRRNGFMLTPGQTRAYTCTATGVTDEADGSLDGLFTNTASAAATFRGRSFSDSATASVELAEPAPGPPPTIEIDPIVPPDPPPDDPDPDDPPPPDDPGGTDPTVTLAVGDDSVLVSGSTVVLAGVDPGCALTVFVDGVALATSDSSADPGTFEFAVPTGELAFGRHEAQVRCDDGSSVFEQPFTVIQPINNSSGLTAILAFVVLILFILAWRFVVSGRDAPGPT